MKAGYLSSYFAGMAVKRLSAVEAHQAKSNQHEFNGTTAMREIFGSERAEYDAQFMYLCEDDDEYAVTQGRVTWYDARQNHATRTEYRLYFPSTEVSGKFNEGDLLIVCQHYNKSVVVIAAEQGSTAESQLIWLFDLGGNLSNKFSVKSLNEKNDIKIAFASRFILDELGIQSKIPEESHLEYMLHKFDHKFPPTREFSSFAREMSKISAHDNPDDVILEWMDQEEKLFMTLERHMVSMKLKNGFGSDGNDVEEFISFSLSVQNRRKSRAGHALENHLEEIFKVQSLRYSRGKITENRAKPDFIFPSIEKYSQEDFNPELLTMLGVKSSCKDRWRQVLSEARKIPSKHLFTMEPGISSNQTDEMKSQSLQLVIPKAIHMSYEEKQRQGLISLDDFIKEVRTREATTSV